jgi:orotate phosphoribosyltransferase
VTTFTKLSQQEIKETLEAKGCVYPTELGHHFVGIGGKHLSGYCNIDPALPDVEFISSLSHNLVEPFKDMGIDTVLVPAIGAIPLAQWGPYHLEQMTSRRVLGVWADKIKPRGFAIERNGFTEAIARKKVLILEDIINQMFSVRTLVGIANDLGADVIGVGAIMVKNTASAKDIGVTKLVSLYDYSYEAWDPSECELCKNNVPIAIDAALGHGFEYKELHPDYAGGYTIVGSRPTLEPAA